MSSSQYRRMNIVIAPDISEWVSSWADTEYAENFAETSLAKGLVSLSMLDAAISEFNEEFETLNGDLSDEDVKDFDRMVKNLEEIRNFWKENTADAVGAGVYESDIEYDNADYGTTPEEESELLVSPEPVE